MNKHIRAAVLLLIAGLAPVSAPAALIDVSDVEVVALASFNTQLRPEQTAFDVKIAPLGNTTQAEALVVAQARSTSFPNLPSSVTGAFASSAADANGFFGVGVSGFFFQNSLPPHSLVASGSSTQSITNNSTSTISMDVDFFIPAPTLQFLNVGNFFPAGVDPARDATAIARISLLTKLTHPDGSTVEKVLLDYGIRTFREPVSGVFLALPIRSFPIRGGVGSLSRFDEPDGSFGFQMTDLEETDFSLGEIGPGDTLEFSYDYFAKASTGFGETAVLAAIGDPFHLDIGGGRFDFQVAPGPATGVPEPGTLATLGLGLVVMLGASARRSHKTKSRP